MPLSLPPSSKSHQDPHSRSIVATKKARDFIPGGLITPRQGSGCGFQGGLSTLPPELTTAISY